ncbi:MAG: class A beta-lactamase, partial [Firmicutes bacterium]|nr:class A beta-lactamase [Bacillota bacterium]
RGHVGVFAMRGSRVLSHRGQERFAYCSSFKWVLGAAILGQVDQGKLTLDREIPFSEKDLMEYSPVTRPQVGRGRMSVRDLCAATIGLSDNTAADLLLPLAGGLQGLTAFVRSHGDAVMRFDRPEPHLNSNLPGDPRDTTTPEAMARLLKTMLETEVLKVESRNQLLAWMKGATTGPERIRKSVPQGWALAHKTGTSGNGAVHDVAVIFPPKGDPIYVCIFTNASHTDLARSEAAIAQAAHDVIETLR